MLPNDPPAGTRVMFLTSIRKAKAYDVGLLVGSVQKYTVERPEDLFEVDFGGGQWVSLNLVSSPPLPSN